jgi:hypothetical protein
VKSFLVFVGGVVVGGFCVLQLRHNETTCSKRVAAGVREELVDAAGPAGGIAGWLYDATNVGTVANPLLDLFGVPYDA